MKTRITIKRGRKKYEVVRGHRCLEKCSFKKACFRGMCEDKCHPPRWFGNIVNDFADGLVCLREIKKQKKGSK